MDDRRSEEQRITFATLTVEVSRVLDSGRRQSNSERVGWRLGVGPQLRRRSPMLGRAEQVGIPCNDEAQPERSPLRLLLLDLLLCNTRRRARMLSCRCCPLVFESLEFGSHRTLCCWVFRDITELQHCFKVLPFNHMTVPKNKFKVVQVAFLLLGIESLYSVPDFPPRRMFRALVGRYRRAL